MISDFWQSQGLPLSEAAIALCCLKANSYSDTPYVSPLQMNKASDFSEMFKSLRSLLSLDLHVSTNPSRALVVKQRGHSCEHLLPPPCFPGAAADSPPGIPVGKLLGMFPHENTRVDLSEDAR